MRNRSVHTAGQNNIGNGTKSHTVQVFLDHTTVDNLADLSHLPNCPWPMKESINLIDGMLGHVDKYVSKSWTCEICDMKSSNVLTLMVLNSSNGSSICV